MEVVPFVHEGLGNSSYLVGLPTGEALLTDPDRTVGRYLQTAEARGWRITTVLETHLHADFISGSRELASAVGARLLIPSGAHAQFGHVPLEAGERVHVDGLEVEAIASPGHTPEHLSYVLRNAATPPALFSGGSLIVGGAARTDLIAPESTDRLTRAQHYTLRHAFEALPDATLLFPTHGAGSFCSTGNSNGERTSTLGNERANNPLLAMADEDEFARWFPTTFPAAPSYFFRLRAVNQAGPRLRADIPSPLLLPPAEFERARAHGALIVDTRSAADYAAGHIPGALSNPFRDAFGVWLGWLVAPETPLAFVTGPEGIGGVVDEALLVGCERLVGWLDGGVPAWERAGLPTVTTAFVEGNAAQRAIRDGAAVLDVREAAEYAAGHVEQAIHVPLGRLQADVVVAPRDRPVVIHCGHGERAVSAASILERAGFEQLIVLSGGPEALSE